MAVVKAMDFLGSKCGKMNEILLASGSPRRLELIQKLSTAWISQLAIPEMVENLDWREFKSPQDYVLKNVKNKLQFALQRISERKPRVTPPSVLQDRTNGGALPDLVIAADTVVVEGDRVLEKPNSIEHNYEMIKSLSGTEHYVLTAVSFVLKGRESLDGLDGQFGQPHTFCTETKVRFMNLDEETKRWYANSQEGSDKAGGYAIQGLGSALIESVTGDFFNVVGFPVNQFVVHLNRVLSGI